MPPFPIWDDVRTFDGRPWRGVVDLVTGGFPCQPFSAAGKQQGESDPRHLWPEIARIIGECMPQYVFLENVPPLLSAGSGAAFDGVLRSLAELGFDAAWGTFSAADLGAPHERKRLWIAAANPAGKGFADRYVPRIEPAEVSVARESSWWAAEPDVVRVVHGLPGRVDRLRGLGNAWVPATAALAWQTLSAVLEENR